MSHGISVEQMRTLSLADLAQELHVLGVAPPKVNNLVVRTIFSLERDGEKISRLDLGEMVSILANAELSTKNFPALFWRIANVRVLLFKTCKAIITGARTRDQARQAIACCVQKLREIGFTVMLVDRPTVINIHLSTALPTAVDLHTLARDLTEQFQGSEACRVRYNPDRSSGMQLKIPSFAATITLYSSGNMIVQGVKSEEDASRAVLYVTMIARSAMQFHD